MVSLVQTQMTVWSLKTEVHKKAFLDKSSTDQHGPAERNPKSFSHYDFKHGLAS